MGTKAFEKWEASVPKILAVDDSVSMRKVYEFTFTGLEGFEVLTAEGVDKAFEVLAKEKVDVVLADLSMSPDGYELCRRLKAKPEWQGLPVILVGSKHTPIDSEKARAVGADATALKPYESSSFIELVKNTIAKAKAAPRPALQEKKA
ncbi:MAG: response regulator, partial [Deltaproteobacteria bacterium]|nr:response regulator [Deltaproteobacteria bacterium]